MSAPLRAMEAFKPGVPVIGRVLEFDAERGLGMLTTRDGDTVAFHCTAISDGSRTVEVGKDVVFVIAPGHLGLSEARDVTPIEAGIPPDLG